MNDLQKYLNSYFGISDEEMDRLATLFIKSEVDKGKYFVKAQQYCNRLSFIQNGFFRVYATAGDKEITQWIASEGSFVTDLNSFIFEQRARWNIQAITDCKIYSLHKKDYLKLINVLPGWPEIEKRFIANCFVALEDRIFSHLSLNTEERYAELFMRNGKLFNEVPAQYLASMLGMSAETFSRIRNKKLS